MPIPQVETGAPRTPTLGGREIRARRPSGRWIALAIVVTLLLATFLPPYLNVNRFQRRITSSIAASLGRPVHLDHVTLNVLPIPGFTLERFIVSEDPAFGDEPTIRANTVRATLRVSSLWRRHVEFSTISFTDPSINLVHLPDGRWNLDSILLQAAHIQAAPTAQQTAGPAPRFPYIEATGARLNLKQGSVKTAFSLTEADLALWLPTPETWHVRITARPVRTDVPAGYTGILHLDGTLGRAANLAAIPLDLHAEWRAAPLGELTRMIFGHDGDLRGTMTLSAALQGTVGTSELHTRLHIEDLRRAAFVPIHRLSITADCSATLASAFHSLAAAQCELPPGTASQPAALTVIGSLNDIRNPAAAALKAEVRPTPASAATPLLQTLSDRTPPTLALSGVLGGSLRFDLQPGARPNVDGSFSLKDASIHSGSTTSKAISLGDLVLQTESPQPASPAPRGSRSRASAPPLQPHAVADTAMLLVPASIPLGGAGPAQLSGRLDRHGYALHLSGDASPQRLAELTAALPPLADGLQQALPAASSVPPPPASPPILHLDLIATRAWGGMQIWQQAPPTSPPTRPRRQNRTPHR